MIDLLRLPRLAAQRGRGTLLSTLMLPSLRNTAHEQRFNELAPRYAEIRRSLMTPGGTGADLAVYEWSKWEAEIADAFRDRVPIDFLSHPRIKGTMVCANTGRLADRLGRISSVYAAGVAEDLLLEDYVGRPIIVDAHYLTSANRAHHAYHLATYELVTRRSVLSARTIVEWGGGYGDLARIVRRLNRDATYVIADVPALCALQYTYLASLEGEEAVVLLKDAREPIVPGKINLVPSSAVALAPGFELRADVFISTWALTECAPAVQMDVARREFFGAKQILMAYTLDANNQLRGVLRERGCQQREVVILAAEGMFDNEYALL